MNVLSVLFQDFHSNSALEAKGRENQIAPLKGATPIEFDILSCTDPLVNMPKVLKSILVSGLNNISIRRNWESLRRDIASLDDHDV